MKIHQSAVAALQNYKSGASIETFPAALKNLELGQAKALLHKEVSDMKCLLAVEPGPNERNSERIPYELATKLMRICLYYDSAMTLADSIFEMSSSLVDKILYTKGGKPNRRHHAVEDILESMIIAEPNVEFARSFAGLYPTLKEFVKDEQNLQNDLANIIALTKSKESIVTHLKITEAALRLTRKLDLACELVQDYLKFADKHLTPGTRAFRND
ncbi:MAG: hypothetical protein ACREBQ_03665 [Nitrososphaerales archaeon]